MQKSAFLARIVSATILSGALFVVDDVAAQSCNTGGCTVYGSPYDSSVTDPHDYNNDHSGDQGDPTSGGNGGGGAGSNYDAAVCHHLIAEVGLPSGCTQQLADAGTPQNLFMTYWGLDALMDSNFGFQRDMHQATYRLQHCYANENNAPEYCEGVFIGSTARAFDERYPFPSAVTEALYAGSMGLMSAEAGNAMAQRIGADFLNFLSTGVSFHGISVRIGGLMSLPMQLNGFNRMWANVKKQLVCKFYMDAKRQNGCP